MPAVTPTGIFVLPTALLGVGTHGPFLSPQVGAAYSAWQLTVAPGLGYPTTPGTVFKIRIERSHDGGATWLEDAFVDYDAGPWTDKAGNALAADAVIRRLGLLSPDVNPTVIVMAPTDLYRVWLDVFRVCSPQISMGGLA